MGCGLKGSNGTVTFSSNLIDVTIGSTRMLWPGMVLIDNADNSTAISSKDGQTIDVQLRDRTLYKDGDWDTLCLPFDVTIADSPLAGDGVTVMELNGSTSGLDASGLLTINFTPVTSGVLTAGKPYIIKWDNTGADIVNPMFSGVTIDGADPATKAVAFSNPKSRI